MNSHPLRFILVFLSLIRAFSCVSYIPSCNQLYPMFSYPARKSDSLNWTLGYISSGNLSTSPQLSMMRFAANYIVNHTDLIPGISLDFLASNIQGSRANAILASVAQIRIYKVASVLGSTTDIEVEATAFLANEFKLPQITAVVQTPSYSNDNKYGYFMRTVPHYADQVLVIEAIMSHFRWTRAVLVTSADTYGRDAQKYIKSKHFSVVQVQLGDRKDGNDLTFKAAVLGKLLSQSYHVVMMFTSYSVGMQLLQQLNASGLIGSNYTYILSQQMTQRLIEDQTCFQSQHGLVDGAIGILPFGGTPGPLFDTLSELWNTSSFKGPRPAPSMLWYAFEAVYLQAIALSKMLAENKDLSQMTGQEFKEAIFNITYEGVTGFVNISHGDRFGDWRVVNFVGEDIATSAKYTYGVPTLKLLSKFTFYGGNENPALEFNLHLENFTHNASEAIHTSFENRSPLFIGLGVLILVVVLFNLASLVILVWHWNKFKAVGPELCCFIHFGALFSFAAAIFLTLEPTPTYCTVVSWLMAFGFDIVYGCLFIKMWALFVQYRKTPKRKSPTLSWQYILKFLGVIIGLEFISLLLWTIFAPARLTTVKNLDSSYESRCEFLSGYWTAWLLPKMVWILTGAALSLFIRNKVKNNYEYKLIAAAIYHTLVANLVVAPTGFALKELPLGIMVIEVAAIVEYFSVTLFILFTPMWHNIFCKPSFPEMRMSTPVTFVVKS